MGPPLAPGFADPVAQSQSVFRGLLDAMARPGHIVTLPDLDLEPVALSPAAGAVALSLVDFETPVWLAAALGEAFPWLRFHCGSPRAQTPRKSRFAFATSDSIPALQDCDLGSDEYPDRSTTLLVEVSMLESGPGLVLSGPGIETTTTLVVGGIAASVWHERDALREIFPRGIDVVLTCGQRLAALPRTTKVEF